MSKFKKYATRIIMLVLLVGFTISFNSTSFSYAAPVAPKIDYVTYLPHSGKLKIKLLNDPLISPELKGYSIVIDTKSNTTPDNNVETIHTLYETNVSFNQNFYVHIATVDQQNNKSVTHHKVVIPKLSIQGTPTSWTNGNVKLNASGTGFDKLILPDGTILSGTSATYTATENKGYTFIGMNKKNERVVVESYIVDNIDRREKNADVSPDDNKWRNKNVKVEINPEG